MNATNETTMKAPRTKNAKKFYVYTPDDGNEDGLMVGYTLGDAKRLARRYADDLIAAGFSGGAQVRSVDTYEIVWSI